MKNAESKIEPSGIVILVLILVLILAIIFFPGFRQVVLDILGGIGAVKG